jgi:hypothetical protein
MAGLLYALAGELCRPALGVQDMIFTWSIHDFYLSPNSASQAPQAILNLHAYAFVLSGADGRDESRHKHLAAGK